MFYLGLDVHSKWTRIEGFDPATGEVISFAKVPNNRAALKAAFAGLEGPLHAAMEIGTNAWAMYWLVSECVDELMVVDSLATWGKEGRRGAKTDRRDARKLAEKLYRGQLQALYVPDKLTQDYRCLIRTRVHTTRRVTALVNEIGALLRSWGVVVTSSLLTDKGQHLLREVAPTLPENSRLALASLQAQLALAQGEEDKLTAQIEQLAQTDPTCQLLQTIPGVGPLTAFGVRAEVGDIGRFASAKHLISYCGLAPVVEQSADKHRDGHLPMACNKILRYLLILRGSALGQSRQSTPLRDTYFRTLLHGHANAAKVNAARKLTRIIYAMLRYQEPWCAAKAATRK
jgi:transposase